MEQQGTDSGSRRRHIEVGALCNNNCMFCMEDDRRRRYLEVSANTPENVREMLVDNDSRAEIMYVTGEPTLNPRFVTYVRWASHLGYRTVGLLSNGRRFAHLPFAKKTVEAGLTMAVIAIHGATADLHDGLTRTPGSFEQCLRGLRNLSRFRKSHGLDIHTSTVLCRRNSSVESMEALYALLSPLVDQVVFNVMQPWGRGATCFDELMPSYKDVAASFARFVGLHPGEELPVSLLDIPYCTTEAAGIPDINRGDLAPPGREPGREVHSSDVGDGEGAITRAKPESCAQCFYDPHCDGVWTNYLEKYGGEQFVPVHHS